MAQNRFAGSERCHWCSTACRYDPGCPQNGPCGECGGRAAPQPRSNGSTTTTSRCACTSGPSWPSTGPSLIRARPATARLRSTPSSSGEAGRARSRPGRQTGIGRAEPSSPRGRQLRTVRAVPPHRPTTHDLAGGAGAAFGVERRDLGLDGAVRRSIHTICAHPARALGHLRRDLRFQVAVPAGRSRARVSVGHLAVGGDARSRRGDRRRALFRAPVQRVPTRSWNVWREEVPWMTLYFSVGVWTSLGMVLLESVARR